MILQIVLLVISKLALSPKTNRTMSTMMTIAIMIIITIKNQHVQRQQPILPMTAPSHPLDLYITTHWDLRLLHHHQLHHHTQHNENHPIAYTATQINIISRTHINHLIDPIMAMMATAFTMTTASTVAPSHPNHNSLHPHPNVIKFYLL